MRDWEQVHVLYFWEGQKITIFVPLISVPKLNESNSDNKLSTTWKEKINYMFACKIMTMHITVNHHSWIQWFILDVYISSQMERNTPHK